MNGVSGSKVRSISLSLGAMTSALSENKGSQDDQQRGTKDLASNCATC